MSLSDVARDLGKTVSVISRVNGGQRRSRVIERAIAQRLGLSLREAFPEWYPGGWRSGGPGTGASHGGADALTPSG